MINTLHKQRSFSEAMILFSFQEASRKRSRFKNAGTVGTEAGQAIIQFQISLLMRRYKYNIGSCIFERQVKLYCRTETKK
jgi:hypothetical protein